MYNNLMSSLTTEQKAYWAGLLDGDGSIMIYNDGDKGYPLAVTIVNNSFEVLDSATFEFDSGHLTQFKSGAYLWQITRDYAYNFLRMLLPYLRIKRKQAELGIEYWQNRSRQKGGKQLPEEEVALREEYYRRMQQLNRPQLTIT